MDLLGYFHPLIKILFFSGSFPLYLYSDIAPLEVVLK